MAWRRRGAGSAMLAAALADGRGSASTSGSRRRSTSAAASEAVELLPAGRRMTTDDASPRPWRCRSAGAAADRRLSPRPESARGGVARHGGGSLRCACCAPAGPVLAGERPACACSRCFPGIALAFELEPLGLLFALIASGLWIVSSVYSIGYMRGNDEAHQTRFYVCFALALAGAIGVAFAGNLLTLYLFYEALTLVDLSARHAPRRRGSEPRRAHLSRACSLPPRSSSCCPQWSWTWSAAGTLDFMPGRHPRRQAVRNGGDGAARAVHVRHRQGGAHAVSPLASGGDGGADAGLRAAARGRGGQGRRVRDRQGRRVRLRPRTSPPGRASTGCRTSPASPSWPLRSSRFAPTT